MRTFPDCQIRKAPQAPGEDFGEVGGAAEFAVAGGLSEQRGGGVAGCGGVVEGAGEGGPGGLGEDLLGQIGQRLAHRGGRPLQERPGKAPTPVVDHGQRLGGCGPVGDTEILGRLSGGLGLLCVVAGAVPVLGGDDRLQEGVPRADAHGLGVHRRGRQLAGGYCRVGEQHRGDSPGRRPGR